LISNSNCKYQAIVVLKISFSDYSLKGGSIVVEKAEYFDGKEITIRQMNSI
jgi:hypothetical protein